MKAPGSGPPLGPPKQANPAVSVTSTTRSPFDEVGDDAGELVDHARSGSHEPAREVPMQNALVADLVNTYFISMLTKFILKLCFRKQFQKLSP